MDFFAQYKYKNINEPCNNNIIPAPQPQLDDFSAFNDAFFTHSDTPNLSSSPELDYLFNPPPESQGRYSIKAGVCHHHLRYANTLPWSGTEFDFETRYCEGCLGRDGFATDIAAALDRVGKFSSLDMDMQGAGVEVSVSGDEGPFMGYPTEFGEQGEGEGRVRSEAVKMGEGEGLDELFEGEYVLDDDGVEATPSPQSPGFGVSFSPRSLWGEQDYELYV